MQRGYSVWHFSNVQQTYVRFKERRRNSRRRRLCTPCSLWIFHFEMSTCLKSWRIFNVSRACTRYVYQLLLVPCIIYKIPASLFNLLSHSIPLILCSKQKSILLQRRIPLMMLDNLIFPTRKKEKKNIYIYIYIRYNCIQLRFSFHLGNRATIVGRANEKGNF